MRFVSFASVVGVLVCGCGSSASNPTDADGIGTSRQKLLGGTCFTHNVHVVDQPGPTQSLWQGSETTETAPSVATDAEFVFVFNQAVDPDDMVATATFKSCNDPNTVAHDVPLHAAWTTPGNLKVVTLKHADQPFSPGCTYTLSIPGDQPVAELLQCLDQPVQFAFRVRDKKEDSPLRKDATSIRYRPKTFDVSSFSLPDTVQIPPASIFQRYAENLGVRPYIDTFDLDATAPSRKDSQTYAQSYLGVPVTGAGYVVHENVNGAVVSATGRVSQGISLDVHPLVLDAAAVLFATASVLKTQHFSKPPVLLPSNKTLVIQPMTPSPGAPVQFKLAWSITLVDQVSQEAFVTVVDARTGAILIQPASNIRTQCNNTNTAGFPAPDAEEGHLPTMLQAKLYQDRDEYSLARFKNGSSDVLALRTDGVGTFGFPVISAQCGSFTSDTTTFATVPSTVSDASFSPEVLSTAASFLGVQRTFEYLSTHPLKPLGTPADEAGWVGFDGEGNKAIQLVVGVPPPDKNSSFYDINHNVLFYVLDTPANPPDLVTNAALDTTGHEFGHGILETIYPSTNQPETMAVAEAFGDILGATVEHSVRGEGPWNFCQRGDAFNNVPVDPSGNPNCLRNLKTPVSSSQGPSPDAFGDGDYSHDPDPDIASHINSTVVSHWFYLLLQGTKDTNSLNCPYDLPAPFLTWDEAMAVVFHAVQSELFKDHNFVDLATATVSVAKELFKGDPAADAKVTRIVDAWAAAGVYEPFWEGLNQTIVPETKAEHVSPWQPIEWDVAPGETAWQLEIQKGTTSDASDLKSPDRIDVTETFVGSDGKTKAVARVALDPNATYFWREHATLPNAENAPCKATHSFSTGDAPTVDNLQIVANLAPDGSVRPGTVEAQWTEIPGAVTYKVFAGTSDPKCATGPGVLPEVDVAGSLTDTEPVGLVPGIQPTTTYTLDVEAVGPNPAGSTTPAVSACASTTFTTIAMRPPVLIAPLDAAPYDYLSPHGSNVGPLSWQWSAFDGPASFSLLFYARDVQGNCQGLLAHEEPITANCAGLLGCTGTFTTDIFPAPPVPSNGVWANPTGYCWTVISKSANGQSAPPTIPILTPHESNSFLLAGPKPSAPGVPRGAAEGGTDPGTLGVRDYEDTSDVKFSWAPVAHASGYFITVGRWPWLNPTSGAADPRNCLSHNPITGADFCAEGPVELTYPSTEVGDTPSTTVPADKAGHGRYCWTVWPVLEDPANPGHDNPLQPLVDPQTNEYCYTTQEAIPMVKPDTPHLDGTTAPEVSGVIVFPYIPGGQGGHSVDFGGANVSSLTHGDSCDVPVTGDPAAWQPGQDFVYGDRYDCEYKFTIMTEPNTEYNIVATVHGYGQKELTDKLSFKTADCGKDGEPCCAGNQCTASDTVCDASSQTCKHCGNPDEPCCEGSPKCAIDRICNAASNTCVFCGTAPGEPCCTDAASIADLGGPCKRMTTNLTCDGKTGLCESCGSPGEVCCSSGDPCSTGSTCDSATNSCKAKPTCTALPAPTGLLPAGGTQFLQSPIPVSWNPVAGATAYEITAQAFVANCIVDATGVEECLSSGIPVGDPLTGPPITQNSGILEDVIPGLTGGNSAPRWVVWSVAAIGECGQRSPSSADSAVVVLF